MNNNDIKKHLKKIRKNKIHYKLICLFGFSRSKWLKKKNIFGLMGENVLYTPDTIPNNPKLIKFHNNIKIAAGVKFYEHDVINQVFRDMGDNCKYVGHKAAIEIYDNVFIGAYSIIVGNVSIGPNVIIGAGTVVTSDIPSGVIVAGNPARIISNFDDLHEKRMNTEIDKYNNIQEQYDYVWNNFYLETRKKCKEKS